MPSQIAMVAWTMNKLTGSVLFLIGWVKAGVHFHSKIPPQPLLPIGW